MINTLDKMLVKAKAAIRYIFGEDQELITASMKFTQRGLGKAVILGGQVKYLVRYDFQSEEFLITRKNGVRVRAEDLPDDDKV